MASERSALRRFFGGVWRFIDGTRKVVLNLVFFALLALVIMSVIDSGESLIIQPDSALVLRPYGDVVEQYSGTPLDYVVMQAAGAERTETRLRDLTEAVRRAATDDRIVRLVIDPSYLNRIGLASLLELQEAVQVFRESGKPVVALADNLGQQQYFLAALADEVWLNPKGMVWIDGFARYRQFYKEGLDKLEVDVNLFRVGKYKSAMEPFIRNDMSQEAKEANLFWIGNLWQQYLDAISRQRGIPLENLSDAINRFADHLEQTDGDFARLAVDIGLVDQLRSRPEANLELARLGAPGEGNSGFRQVSQDEYLAHARLKPKPAGKQKVFILVAEGDIVRGQQPQGTIGAVTLSEKLRSLAEDSDVKAVVLRVDSPGGDAFASEKIRLEVQALREMGKTVVVSMGDVAASGGYWISMAADEVWASPTTVTGSIGVFGLLPTFQKPLNKMGIHSDGVGTTPLAGKLRVDRPLDPDLQRIFQHATERVYDDFIELVSGARHMSPEAVHEVAQGRVWSGSQAKERGLIDQTGTLQQAVDAAARIAGLGTDYSVVYDEWEMTPFETMLLEMLGSAATHFAPNLTRLRVLEHSLFDGILGDLRLLLDSNQGLTIAAHCLCRVD